MMQNITVVTEEYSEGYPPKRDISFWSRGLLNEGRKDKLRRRCAKNFRRIRRRKFFYFLKLS